MEKRLSRSDYLFALLFIFMLIFIIAAFFYGMSKGEARVRAAYEEQQNKKKEQEQLLPAYNQQYLVSFYHTIFAPFIDFEKKWFELQDNLEFQTGSIDPADSLKQLSGIASHSYDALAPMTMPASSPLLQDARQQYMNSLNLFAETFNRFRSNANSVKGAELLKQLEADEQYQKAKQAALAAQSDYYEAMELWYKSDDFTFETLTHNEDSPIGLKDWSTRNLLAKDGYIASYMEQTGIFKPYMPQDLAARIDEAIITGRAAQLNITTVKQLIDLFVTTNAIRPGDFLKMKEKFYSREPLPQLPFFLAER
ncbi:MAG: hypothetical protein K0R75_118 [Paenibacillaceae bacterium]|jgi:hypothetical protein|nr:hypothetical protein [Paenibacillaceae bacterium]